MKATFGSVASHNKAGVWLRRRRQALRTASGTRRANGNGGTRPWTTVSPAGRVGGMLGYWKVSGGSGDVMWDLHLPPQRRGGCFAQRNGSGDDDCGGAKTSGRYIQSGGWNDTAW